MSTPKVTVLMSVYNNEDYLPLCLDSILGQSLGDFEFVIVDDGSADDSHLLKLLAGKGEP